MDLRGNSKGKKNIRVKVWSMICNLQWSATVLSFLTVLPLALVVSLGCKFFRKRNLGFTHIGTVHTPFLLPYLTKKKKKKEKLVLRLHCRYRFYYPKWLLPVEKALMLPEKLKFRTDFLFLKTTLLSFSVLRPWSINHYC